MRAAIRAASWRGGLWRLGWIVAVGSSLVWATARARTEPEKRDPVAAGYEIFNREWLPGDARSHGGDGLGPVYNDSSCVACHNAGGSGGAGPANKNIDLLSAASSFTGAMSGMTSMGGSSQPIAAGSDDSSKALLEALAGIHSGFRTSRNVVLHKFGTDPNYGAWRNRTLAPRAFSSIPGGDVLAGTIKMRHRTGENSLQAALSDAATANLAALEARLTELRKTLADTKASRAKTEASDNDAATRMAQVQAALLTNPSSLRKAVIHVDQSFTVTRSQRNPTALFGLGLIDAIPAEAIKAVAQRQAKEAPQAAGRVSQLRDGRIGRLGWKGQIASVDDFVLNACAVELGLEVPGHPQALVPQAPKYRASGLDLTAEECSSLVAYVKSLPKPVERQASGVDEAKSLSAGRATFASIGCAVCHSPDLGGVQGIYSDLLLHTMGLELAEEGSYGRSSEDDGPLVPATPRDLAITGGGSKRIIDAQGLRGASLVEWRTPPLWGFRDSGPYLHDGRAETLEQAVALHGGQGQASALRFFALPPRERLQVEAFLKSLVAPPTGQLASR